MVPVAREEDFSLSHILCLEALSPHTVQFLVFELWLPILDFLLGERGFSVASEIVYYFLRDALSVLIFKKTSYPNIYSSLPEGSLPLHICLSFPAVFKSTQDARHC